MPERVNDVVRTTQATRLSNPEASHSNGGTRGQWLIEFDRGRDVRELEREASFPRSVRIRRVAADGEIRTDEPLDRLAAERADGLRTEVLRGFYGRMVAVEHLDGMTTSAGGVQREVRAG